MATFSTDPSQSVVFGLFNIGVLEDDYVYSAGPTLWRTGPTSSDLGTNVEFLGLGFTYSGGSLVGGTVQSITTHTSGSVSFQITGMSMSVATFNAYKSAADSQGFLAAVFSGNDTMSGSDQVDHLNGYAGVDHLEGNGGNDVLDGGAGSDTLVGGLGDDLYVIDSVGDVIIESGKNLGDTVDASISIDLTKAAYDGIEHVTLRGSANLSITGDSFGNHLDGNAGANKLSGAAANDTLSGLAGNDILDGGSGNDTLKGGSGNDTYYVDAFEDSILETKAGGTDIVFSSAKNFSLVPADHVENLTLTGTAESGTGNNLINILTGNAEANHLDGRGGADIMIGGAGDDEYYVDTAQDTVTETSTGGMFDVVVSSASTYTLPNYVEWLSLTGTAVGGIGNNLANSISGNDGANTLNGAGGNDLLSGGGGDDTLIGGAGNDTYIGGPGVNTIDTNLGNDSVHYFGGLDVIQGFDGNATGGQDRLRLESYFFDLGVADEDRAERVHVSDHGTVVDVWLDYDGNGSFDFQIAEIHSVDVIKVNEDIVVA